MPKTTKGHANCPECNHTQAVQFDGKKYFISCTECRTFTSYQSKEAKARIQQRLTPLEETPQEPEEQPPRVGGTPDIDVQGCTSAGSAGGTGAVKTNTQPYKPVRTKSFIESLAEYL